MGEYIWQQEVINPDDQWKWAVESVREIGEHAQKLGREMAIELEPFHLSIVNNIPKMLRFLRNVDLPVVKANIDISHLALVHAAPKEILDLKSCIAHAHLSDCDGKKHGDLPPGRGVVDFIPYLEALRDAELKGVISIELEYSPEPAKIDEWVTEAYRQTDRMMRSLNIRN